MNIYYVYKHTFPNGAIYIGKGKGGRAYAFNKRDTSPYWKHTYEKYKIVCVEMLDVNLSEDVAYELEEFLISEYISMGYTLGKGLINLTMGGEGFKGKHSSESKIKMSKSRLGNTNRKNTKTSAQGIENIRKGQLGRKMSKQACRNISKSQMKPVQCIETGIVYESMQIASWAVGLKTGDQLRKHLTGKGKSAGGFTWKFIPKE